MMTSRGFRSEYHQERFETVLRSAAKLWITSRSPKISFNTLTLVAVIGSMHATAGSLNLRNTWNTKNDPTN